jgi:hypothetical protein
VEQEQLFERLWTGDAAMEEWTVELLSTAAGLGATAADQTAPSEKWQRAKIGRTCAPQRFFHPCQNGQSPGTVIAGLVAVYRAVLGPCGGCITLWTASRRYRAVRDSRGRLAYRATRIPISTPTSELGPPPGMPSRGLAPKA